MKYLIMLTLVATLVLAPQPAHATGGSTAVAADAGDIRVHDPMMLKQGHTYYVFSTGGGLQIRSSTDLKTWRCAGDGFCANPSWAIQTGRPVSGPLGPVVSFFHWRHPLLYA